MIKRKMEIIVFTLTLLPTVVQANTIVVDQGNVYEQRCALCHGSEGVSEIPDVPNLTQTTMSIDQIKEIIENGQGQMPIIRIDARQRHEAAQFVMANIKK
jgi:mono/diheme cytochrome c family protein